MKPLYFLSTVITAVFFFLNQSGAEEKTIKLASFEYPPYYGENLQNQGVTAEIIKTAFESAAYQVTIQFLPIARGEQLVRDGKIDGVFTLWYRKEREAWCIYSDPIPPPNELVLFKPRDRRISYASFADLSGYRVGYVHGYQYPAAFNVAALRKIKSYSDEENIQKLTTGVVDIVITDKLQAKYLMQNHYPDRANNFDAVAPPLQTDQQYLVISKKIPLCTKVLMDFNKGLGQITKAGIVAKIQQRHGF